jgi:hypothetical protein
MRKKLNIDNLVPHELEADLGTHPWGDLIYDDGCLVSTYAAQACLKELSDSWTGDFARDRVFILGSVNTTVTLLTRWARAFAVVMEVEDKSDLATEELAGLMAERRITPQALADISKMLAEAAKVATDSGFSESDLRALAKSAFSPNEE